MNKICIVLVLLLTGVCSADTLSIPVSGSFIYSDGNSVTISGPGMYMTGATGHNNYVWPVCRVGEVCSYQPFFTGSSVGNVQWNGIGYTSSTCALYVGGFGMSVTPLSTFSTSNPSFTFTWTGIFGPNGDCTAPPPPEILMSGTGVANLIGADYPPADPPNSLIVYHTMILNLEGTATAVPEPGSLMLLGTGALGLLSFWKRHL